ncbi:MAG: hypothetical protein Q9207_002183 [Kuettlingeria erythrocarpa]
MAELLQNELEAIGAHPLRKELDTFRTTFKSRYPTSEDVNLTEIVKQLTSEASDPGETDVLLDFLFALLKQPAARIIRSRTGNRPLFGDISSLIDQIMSNTLKTEYIAPLIKLVLTKAEDTEIWIAVFDLVARTKPIPRPVTPPEPHPSFTPSFQQTPWSFNTGGFVEATEHRKKIDDVLKEELRPTLRIDIPDFILAVFGHISRLDELAQTVFDRCQDEDTRLYIEGSGWTKWPRSAEEESVLEWLQDLMKRFVAWTDGVHPAASRQIYKGPKTYLDGSAFRRKMDVGVMACHGQSKTDHGTTHRPKSSWAQILVTGELKSNPIEDGHETTWLDLARYAREVFRAQDRRFVLGFTLCGSRMRLWHFDRSGSSGSSSFDINQDGLKFVRVMLGYYLMNDKQLGLDPTIQHSDGQRYVEITRDDQIERLVLTEEIRKHAVIAGRATACWRAYCDKNQSKEPLVVKMSWQYEERPEEGELIKEATDKGVKNIARYYHHETVQVDGKNDDTIENVRRGLMKICGRTRFTQSSLNEPDASASEPQGEIVADPSRSQSQSPSLSRKRSSSTAQMAPPASSKRSRSSFESRNSGSSIYNRVHRLIITRDPGKPMYQASSPVALINGLVGAIKGHESSLNAGILHRDISIGNIMLTENEDDGFLIDYDLAIKTNSDRASGAPSMTGTKVFMAIGALLREPHSFMHDLESFFWVLFWICIHWHGRDKKTKESDFEHWNYLSTTDLAVAKAGRISKKIFNTVDGDFTDHCKPLIPCLKELHKVVFVEGSCWFRERRELYSEMTTVLKKARNILEAKTVDYRLKYLAELELEGTFSSKPRQSSNLAGTKIFMAIGALRGEPHSFMHDLESFFWVLFWICICWDGPGQERRKVKEFEEWNTKRIEELAEIKIGKVFEEDVFDEEMSDHFSEYCKPLIPCMQELRKVVFPGGKRWLSEDRELYSKMTDILEEAKERLDL